MELIKNASRKLGLYRQARWINRHVFNRQELSEERNNLAFYSEIIKPGDLVYDVGANWGEKSRSFLKLGTKVVAFEPQPDCRAELLERCGNRSALTVIDKALGSERGETQMFVHPKRGSSSLVTGWREGTEATIDIEVTTLDDMFRIHGRPSYIKIDVEGFELEVLKGLSQPIPCISLEYHLTEENIQITIDCLKYLSGLADLKINLAKNYPMEWEFPEWLGLDEFLKLFPSSIEGKKGYWYGDIFVKMG